MRVFISLLRLPVDLCALLEVFNDCQWNCARVQ